MRKGKFPEMQVGMRIKVQNNNKWYEGKIVKKFMILRTNFCLCQTVLLWKAGIAAD